MTVLAMFPLGSTVFPQQIVPLHVFEPRYRQMMEDLTATHPHPEFGIVLIDRGQEVGGGDQRTSVGTRVVVIESRRQDDGRWAVVAAGKERLDVLEWLSDDPYPRAEVASRVVVDNGGSDIDELQAEVTETLRLVAAASRMAVPGSFEFSADVRVRLDELSAVAPVSDFDRQQILEAPSTREQMALLTDALQTKQMLLRAQLGHGDELG